MNAWYLPGPVALTQDVRATLADPPASHRDAPFLELMSRTRTALSSLANASHVVLMVGTGTLANDAVAAQLQYIEGSGLILSNGEFGGRLIDHARRWNLTFATEHQHWGQPFDWTRVRRSAATRRPRWIWGVLSETSTGVVNPTEEFLRLKECVGAELCLDAISAIGLIPVSLKDVRFATAVSGKGLAALPGLAAVFHDGRLAPSRQIPRYLDLAEYQAADSVPFTHSSNLLAALGQSLAMTRWPEKFERVRCASRALRAALRAAGLPPLAAECDSMSGITTVALPGHVNAEDVATGLSRQGFHLAFQSNYLKQRNWLQICLMGEFDETLLAQLPGALTRQVASAIPIRD